MAALSARDEGAEGLRHIVRYYQAWIEDERLYIQTELCDASLESRVRRGRFLPTPPAVWGFLRQMLLALELLLQPLCDLLDVLIQAATEAGQSTGIVGFEADVL